MLVQQAGQPAGSVGGELCNRTINYSALEQRFHSAGRDPFVSTYFLQIVVDEHLGAGDQPRRHLLEARGGHVDDWRELRPGSSGWERREGRRGATTGDGGEYA